MRNAILANPYSGTTTPEQKKVLLHDAALVLDAPILGLETRSVQEFINLANSLIKEYDVLIVAGGDGTFSDIINGVDLSQIVLAFLPLGSGNSLRHALGYRGKLENIAHTISKGIVHECDLIDCDSKRLALLATVGIEGNILHHRETFSLRGERGFFLYLHAMFAAYFGSYKSTRAKIEWNGNTLLVDKLLSFMVTKHPFYGYGMNLMPEAKLEDKKLHVRAVKKNFVKALLLGAGAFTIGNRIGHYADATNVCVTLEQPLWLQIDGNIGWCARQFHFDIATQKLRLFY